VIGVVQLERAHRNDAGLLPGLDARTASDRITVDGAAGTVTPVATVQEMAAVAGT